MVIWLVLVSACLIEICYLYLYRPFDDDLVLKLEIFNEFTNLVLLYHILLFSDWISDASTRYLIGWAFIGANAINMSVHFFLLLKETFASMKDWCKAKCCGVKDNQVMIEKKELAVVREAAYEDTFESNFSDNAKANVARVERYIK